MSKIAEILQEAPHKIVIEIDNNSDQFAIYITHGDFTIGQEISMPKEDIEVINQVSIMMTALHNKISGQLSMPQYYIEKP